MGNMREANSGGEGTGMDRLPSVLLVSAPADQAEIGKNLPVDGEFTVRRATSAGEALHVLQTNGSVECIVSEQDLPDIDGVALLEAVRAQHSELPFILFVRAGSEEIASRAISARVTEYLVRERIPDQSDQLTGLIADAVSSYRRRRSFADPDLNTRAILEATPNAMLIVRDGSIVFANQRAVDLYGVDSRTELTGQSPESYIPTDERELTTATLASIQAGRQYVDRMEQTVVGADGTSTPVEVTAAAIQWEEDPATLLILRDLSDKRRRVSELRRFKQAVESSIDLLAAIDEDLMFLFANETYCTYHGFEQEAVIGEPLPEVIGQEAYSRVESDVEAALDGEVVHSEITREFPDLGERILDVRFFPLLNSDGSIGGAGASMRDVTPQKEYEAELERYRDLVDNIPVGVFRTSTTDSGELVEVNQAAVDMFDASSEADLLGRPVWDLLVEESEADVIEAEIERSGVVETETRLRTIDGGAFWAKVVSIQRETDRGETFAEGIIIDVTERKERERELETVISNLPGIVYRCRNEEGWPMEMVRGRSEDLVGYSTAAIERGLVSWDDDIIHPDDREMVWETVQAAVENDEAFELTYRIRTRSGEEKWVWEQGRAVTPLHAGEARLEGIISDISERKQLEEDLIESKERYESLFTSIRDAILVADTDRRITNCNPAFTDIFGYELEEIEGKPTSYVYHDEEEFLTMGQEITRHMGDPSFTFTIDYETKSGRVFPGETNVFYLRDADDEVAGYIGVIRDISEREDRLTQMKWIDRVLQHNFSNDMNVIEGYASRIQETGSDPVTDWAAQIIETGEKLLSTVRKEREITLFLSDPPARTALDLGPMLDRTVENLTEEYPNAAISLDFENPVRVRASTAIERALEELLTNAIIHADSAHPIVDVDVEQQDDIVRIRVMDQGPLIPEMEQKVLTGERELEPLYHGSGLGLWLVNLIVRQAGGVLDFRRNQPRGNVVTIRLPTGSKT